MRLILHNYLQVDSSCYVMHMLCPCSGEAKLTHTPTLWALPQHSDMNVISPFLSYERTLSLPQSHHLTPGMHRASVVTCRVRWSMAANSSHKQCTYIHNYCSPQRGRVHEINDVFVHVLCWLSLMLDHEDLFLALSVLKDYV